MIGLSSLEYFNRKRGDIPSNLEQIYYLFFRRGIDIHRFNELPIPYIYGIVKCFAHEQKEREAAYKKANRRK